LEGGQVDSWIEFCTHELELPLNTWVYTVQGWLEEVPEATRAAKEDVKHSLSVLDKHLLTSTYMVGNRITLADISICCSLVDAFRLVLDEQFRKSYGNLMRWFSLVVTHHEVESVVGKVELLTSKAGAKAKTKAAAKSSSATPAVKSLKDSVKQGKEGNAVKEGKRGKQEKAAPAPTQVKTCVEKDDVTFAQERAAKKKKVIKEGGKRGVEIEGAADLGGLMFFCTSVDEPQGDLDLLDDSVQAMNAKVREDGEERKGGSRQIGKMIFSAGDDQLGIVAYVPETRADMVDAKEWMQWVLKLFGGELAAGATKLYAKGFVKADSNQNKFPLKMKEPSITEAIAFLKSKGAFPDKDDSDDDMVFGDDDFPE